MKNLQRVRQLDALMVHAGTLELYIINFRADFDLDILENVEPHLQSIREYCSVELLKLKEEKEKNSNEKI